MQQIKNKISDSHTITIDIKDEYSFQYSYNLITKNRHMIRILITEPVSDIRYLYSEFLKGLGLEILVVENGSKYIEYLSISKD